MNHIFYSFLQKSNFKIQYYSILQNYLLTSFRNETRFLYAFLILSIYFLFILTYFHLQLYHDKILLLSHKVA